MIEGGQVVLFTFPKTDQAAGKLRPALVLQSLPGSHDDWLICMISSQLRQQVLEAPHVGANLRGNRLVHDDLEHQVDAATEVETEVDRLGG